MGSKAGRFAVALSACLIVALSAAAIAGAKGTAYIVGNFSTPDVDARSIADDGQLSPLGTVPVGGTPRSVAITPNGKVVYASDLGGDKILAYSVGATGALTSLAGQPVGGFPVGAASDPEGLAVSPDGGFLFSANLGTGAISSWSIDSAGVLTPVGNAALTNIDAIAVSSNGRFLYATANTVVQAFSVTNGVLAPVGAAVPAGANVKGIAVTPDGKFVLVSDSGSPGAIRSFAIAGDGTLAAAGGPVPSGNASDTLAVSQDGRFVYVANGSNAGTVSAYQIGGDGSLTAVPNQPFAAGALSRGIDAGPGGRVYVADYVDPVAGFSTASVFDSAANGTLSPVPTSPFTLAVRGTEYQSIAVTPNQGPVAALTSTPAAAGSPTQLDASASADSDGNGSVASYAWDFGDGQTATTTTATTQHVYAQPGTYTGTVTVTDPEGCSTAVIFTGQTADCNGSAAATASTPVTVPQGGGGGGDAPDLRLFGGKTQKLDAAVEVGARCDEPCAVAATGKLIVRTPSGRRIALAVKRFNLKPASAQFNGKKKVTLALKVPRKARRAGLRALKRGGRVRARLSVTATNATGGSETEKRGVRLVKP